MAPTLLLTRPLAASQRFARMLGRQDAVISPIIRIVPVAHDAGMLAAARGLVFTSAHAVPAAGPGQARQAFCVGPATAKAARAAGFAVTEGPGDAAGLAPMLAGLGPGWVHPHGAHLAARLPVPGVVVYDQQAQPLSSCAQALLAGAGPVILPLFSPRSARLAGMAAEGARADLWIVAISAAVAQAWPGPSARVVVAGSPDAAGMAAAVNTLLAGEQT
ncbi:uroporphyrinogen-III synthase [Paracoccus shanxieyensis]|uniref:Uroporphyrinogen-III synthase n=1 Tax=Paracoccus shanxieyensis TaxID=2675752 RepID=A0A6L6ISA1_9RHOB|nr:uroporphyrinogen-III synthase [Paracoccus shanxieyensis]MTH63346.1 uroporphyrinogen-III synthase [Paracoccus shanxieyensis]MTH87260.1 uroporphyrinogen-III synthase [Paracoccus shanxieyensis]